MDVKGRKLTVKLVLYEIYAVPTPSPTDLGLGFSWFWEVAFFILVMIFLDEFAPSTPLLKKMLRAWNHFMKTLSSILFYNVDCMEKRTNFSWIELGLILWRTELELQKSHTRRKQCHRTKRSLYRHRKKLTSCVMRL